MQGDDVPFNFDRAAEMPVIQELSTQDECVGRLRDAELVLTAQDQGKALQMESGWRLELVKRSISDLGIVVNGYSLFRSDGARLDVLGKNRENAEQFRYIHGTLKIDFTATQFDAEGKNPSTMYDVWLGPALKRLERADPASLDQFNRQTDEYQTEIADALLAWSRLRPNSPAVASRVRFKR